jgi:hypothetical protein
MNKRNILAGLLAIVLLLGLTTGWSQAQEVEPQSDVNAQATVGTAFTYQGKLTDGRNPANGEYDFQFDLHDDPTADSQVGSTINVTKVITDGLFTVELDFGDVFDGTALWLEIGVRPGGSGGSYTTLDPRQPLNAAPYAHSLRPGATVEGSPGLVGNIFQAETPNGDFGGAFGTTFLLGAAGAYGHTDIQGMGIYGQASNSSYTAYGVYGLHDGSGDGYGGYFEANDEDNAGLYATAPETAIVGRAYTDTINSTAVLGENPESGTRQGAGVRGLAGSGEFEDLHPSGSYYNAGGEFAGPNGLIGAASSADTHSGWGVIGITPDSLGRGVYGYASANSGTNYGVYGRTDSSGGYAGYFVGDVEVTGNLDISGSISKGGGSFKIDHPQDPENKYLSHSFVESPERTNVYNGNVTTDDRGYATVQLPDYFEALNKDYTYQLTVIGTFAQAIVAEEVQNNQFVIQTDQPNVKVSWQVTGVRQDPWAEAHPFEDESEKPPEEQGTYLHPELYDQPASLSIQSAHEQVEQGGQ